MSIFDFFKSDTPEQIMGLENLTRLHQGETIVTQSKGNTMNYFLLIPQIIATVKALEELLPDTPGKQKFEMLLKTLEDIYGTVVENIPALEKFVTAVVNIAKVLGVFKSKAK